MNFRDFITDPATVASRLIESPGDLWRQGSGKASPAEELATVLHYAGMGFPPGGKSLTIQPPHNTTALYDELMKVAKRMENEGRLVIDTEANGYTYIGKPQHVKDAMRLTMRRKPELLADEEQHRAIGRLLGYDEDAIEEFVRRFRDQNGLRDDLA